MKVYQAPKMKLERLTLFEKIAETCWGYKRAFFDNPYDGVNIVFTKEFSGNSGCGNNSEDNDVLKWLKATVFGNSQEIYDKYMNEYGNNSNNLANTKAGRFTLSNS